MSHFTQISDLPILDLHKELDQLIAEDKIWYNRHNQICINTLPDQPDSFFAGAGSIWYDWEKAVEIIKDDGSIDYQVPERKVIPKETDFSILCNKFKNTAFEEVYLALKNKFKENLGRIRIMRMRPKTCLSWHQDSSYRSHYPMKTDEGCMMIIDNEVKHMPQYTWWHTNTVPYHTALNGSSSDRIHLVCAVHNPNLVFDES